MKIIKERFNIILKGIRLAKRFALVKIRIYYRVVLGRNLFSIANDCSVNLTDLSKILVKKQMKHFDVPLDHGWKGLVFQELLNTRTNNLYVEGFDDYIITEMINFLCKE